MIIKSEKQSNGLWGCPLQLIKLDRGPSEVNEVKFSAIVMLLAETYKDETFEIFWSTENGFYIKLSRSGMKKIIYDDYILIDNELTYRV